MAPSPEKVPYSPPWVPYRPSSVHTDLLGGLYGTRCHKFSNFGCHTGVGRRMAPSLWDFIMGGRYMAPGRHFFSPLLLFAPCGKVESRQMNLCHVDLDFFLDLWAFGLVLCGLRFFSGFVGIWTCDMWT